jgi:TolB-like protein/Flp pilus assembly protein TadD
LKRTEDVDLATKRRTKSHAWIYVVVVAAVLSIGLFFLGRFTAPAGRSSADLSAKSIAVLPFDNLSRDPDNAYFTEGIQDEILTRLAKVADLKVISRTSTQRFRSSPDNLPQIAKQLGVMHVLEGSVQRSADQVRVNVQLINAMTDAHLWAEIYDRKLSDIFAVESEIAKTIADSLQAKLTGMERTAMSKQPTANTEAYQLYLKGRFFWNKRTAADLRKARNYFEQSAAVDPNYALAYSGVADADVLLPLYGGGEPGDFYPRAKAAANKAIALDPNLGEPHAALGLIASVFDFDFAVARQEFERAIALNPNYATAHHWLGDSVYECTGEHDRFVAELKRAVELDPLSVVITGDLGLAYAFSEHYAEAIAQARKSVDLDPNSYSTHFNLGQILEWSGDVKGAITEYEKALAMDDDPFVIGLLGHAQGVAGNREAAQHYLEQIRASSRYSSDYSIGLIYLGLGDKNQAMDWFEKSFAKRQPDLNSIRFDPNLRALHGDPRFERLVEKILPAAKLEMLTRK